MKKPYYYAKELMRNDKSLIYGDVKKINNLYFDDSIIYKKYNNISILNLNLSNKFKRILTFLLFFLTIYSLDFELGGFVFILFSLLFFFTYLASDIAYSDSLMPLTEDDETLYPEYISYEYNVEDEVLYDDNMMHGDKRFLTYFPDFDTQVDYNDNLIMPYNDNFMDEDLTETHLDYDENVLDIDDLLESEGDERYVINSFDWYELDNQYVFWYEDNMSLNHEKLLSRIFFNKIPYINVNQYENVANIGYLRTNHSSFIKLNSYDFEYLNYSLIPLINKRRKNIFNAIPISHYTAFDDALLNKVRVYLSNYQPETIKQKRSYIIFNEYFVEHDILVFQESLDREEEFLTFSYSLGYSDIDLLHSIGDYNIYNHSFHIIYPIFMYALGKLTLEHTYTYFLKYLKDIMRNSAYYPVDDLIINYDKTVNIDYYDTDDNFDYIPRVRYIFNREDVFLLNNKLTHMQYCMSIYNYLWADEDIVVDTNLDLLSSFIDFTNSPFILANINYQNIYLSKFKFKKH